MAGFHLSDLIIAACTLASLSLVLVIAFTAYECICKSSRHDKQRPIPSDTEHERDRAQQLRDFLGPSDNLPPYTQRCDALSSETPNSLLPDNNQQHQCTEFQVDNTFCTGTEDYHPEWRRDSTAYIAADRISLPMTMLGNLIAF